MSLSRKILLSGSLMGFVAVAVSLFWPERKLEASADGNLAKNSGFEQWNNNLPLDWGLEKKVAGKGSVHKAEIRPHAGESVIELTPNGSNTAKNLGENPFGIGQGYPAGPLRGKKIYVSAWLGARGGATAVVGVYAVTIRGGVVPVELRETGDSSSLRFQEDVVVIPNNRSIAFIVLACSVYGTTGAAYFDDVYMSTTVPENFGRAPVSTPSASPNASSTELTARITVNPGNIIRQIPSTLFGTNVEWIWDANGMWDRQRNAVNPEVLSLTRDLGVTLMRFPGGFFSDFYHWRDGVGPQENRKETTQMPGSGKSRHVFGTDEALAFADAVGGQLLITANAGTGTAAEAADWVRYVNKDGRHRVIYWEIGNELYEKSDTPWSKASTLPPDRYARRVVEFATAMRAVDPTIKIGAIGEESFSSQFYPGYQNWTEQVLQIAGPSIDFLSVHNAYSPGLGQDKGWDVRTVYSAMLAAPNLIKRSLDRTSAKINRLVPGGTSRVKIAITEWGPYFQITQDGRFTDHVKTLGSALYVASAMKAFMESPQTELANSFKLLDPLYMGWIGKHGDHYLPTGPYLATEMYTKHFGRTLVETRSEGPSYSAPAVGLVDKTETPFLDVMASIAEGGKKLYVLAINKNFDQAIQARIDVGPFRPGQMTAWVLDGPGIDANTGTIPFAPPGMTWAKQATDGPIGWFNKGAAGELKLERRMIQHHGAFIEYSFPAHSVVSIEMNGETTH